MTTEKRLLTTYWFKEEPTNILATSEDLQLVKDHINDFGDENLQPLYAAYKGIVYEQTTDGTFCLTVENFSEAYALESDVIDWIDNYTKEHMKITLDGIDCIIELGYYSNNRLGLWLTDVESGDAYADITVNLISAPCGDNQAYIDVNNLRTDDYGALINNGIIDPIPVSSFKSGFVTYPLHNILISV